MIHGTPLKRVRKIGIVFRCGEKPYQMLYIQPDKGNPKIVVYECCDIGSWDTEIAIVPGGHGWRDAPYLTSAFLAVAKHAGLALTREESIRELTQFILFCQELFIH